MYSTVLYCTVLHCTALYRVVADAPHRALEGLVPPLDGGVAAAPRRLAEAHHAAPRHAAGHRARAWQQLVSVITITGKSSKSKK